MSEPINNSVIDNKYVPCQAIIIYEGADAGHYLESRDIEIVDGKLVTSNDRPFDEETLMKIATQYAREKIKMMSFKGIIPENIVFVKPAGGTGSVVLTGLAKMHVALNKLDHQGLKVTVIDDDKVTKANIGRQMFAESDIGTPKSQILISRVNRFFGLNWESLYQRYPANQKDEKKYNIIITCVDNADTRMNIDIEGDNRYGTYQVSERPYYWLDYGNSKNTGQVILGTIGKIQQPTHDENGVAIKNKSYVRVAKLKTVKEMYPDLKKLAGKDDTPSCSLAEALNKQDLFINPTLAQFGLALLWKLIREGKIRMQGCFMNLETLKTVPIPI
jgi:PRTRC genetic system ThiF family protein